MWCEFSSWMKIWKTICSSEPLVAISDLNLVWFHIFSLAKGDHREVTQRELCWRRRGMSSAYCRRTPTPWGCLQIQVGQVFDKLVVLCTTFIIIGPWYWSFSPVQVQERETLFTVMNSCYWAHSPFQVQTASWPLQMARTWQSLRNISSRMLASRCVLIVI